MNHHSTNNTTALYHRNIFVENFTEGEEINEVFYVEEKNVKKGRTGQTYLDLNLKDKTGTINAKLWDWKEDKGPDFSAKDFVLIRGRVESFRDKPQLNVHSIQVLNHDEVPLEDFISSLPRAQIDKYFEEFFNVHLAVVEDPHLIELLTSFFTDTEFIEKFKKCPAAKEVHHNFQGGLLKHVIYMLRIGRLLTAKVYKDLNQDMLIAGIVFHDIGKIRELEADISINYTIEGQLIGHAVEGIMMIRERAAKIPGFPENLLCLLEHMLLSHHGIAEFGAVKYPAFKEAMLLHLIDSIDSKMNLMDKVYESSPENELITDRSWALDNNRLIRINDFLGKIN